jgi:hypothetical protein
MDSIQRETRPSIQREDQLTFLVVNEGGDTDNEITRVRALFVDGHNIPMPATWHLDPDFITSRDETHWHAYWRVADIEFNEAQRRLAAHYGTDPKVCNPSRVMRLAGTVHLKDPSSPRVVTIETLDPGFGDPRSRSALLAGLQPVPPKTEREPRKAAPDVDIDASGRVALVQMLARQTQPAVNLVQWT